MQSKQINLYLTPSKLPLIALVFAFICSYLISYYLPSARFIVFGLFVASCLYWLVKYLSFKNRQITINTVSHVITIRHKHEVQLAQLEQYKLISWWLSIVSLRIAGTRHKIYVFADSVPFNIYKSFKIFSQWT